MTDNNFYHSALRAALLAAYGIETVRREDCKEISIKIFNKDKNYLSEYTILTYFGFISSNKMPAPFVLNSMARFTGHKNWDQFKIQFEEQRSLKDKVFATK
jgi:hypothetical protein